MVARHSGLNRIPDPMRQQIIQLALNEPALPPRELASWATLAMDTSRRDNDTQRP
jgi:hypothetical protein